ncbi:RsmE family RNA methyltransferase [Spiroplasma diminutum]|uniref:Ribosomal RNA small subunit methyltransferase E n=1 Tax=Spiroplasma diminutum CUAS-1 TaxID=1276221 RepID=S5LZL5_9MOLU|nr:RsmE family RNA methyltransferase [Spiroplasma diminutum]AGR42036.1 16S ribosomal RNA methyltransferase RsmE [Spiroplasma diminutum CUAS-1]
MHSFFLDKMVFNHFEIINEDFHHIKNVIKLKENEKIICVFNDEKFLCSIKEINTNSCKAEIISKFIDEKKDYKVNLILGIIREQKWDFVLQKATELGADCIIPVEFKRNVVKIDIKKEINKISRWYSICENAAKQSKRNNIPRIKPIIRKLEDLKEYNSDLNLICWEDDNSNFIKNEIKNSFETINIVIGPEGGISEQEVNLLNKMGYKSVNLGNNIMRAETVPLYVLSCLNYEKNKG